FKPLYPIKVNQRKREINTVVKSHSDYGLEAGTKSELLLILNELIDNRSRLIMCNGVKDFEYVNIIKQSLDENYMIYISIESTDELHRVLNQIDKNKLQLIFRIKPYVNTEGHWSISTGRNSKFGLSINELKKIQDILRDRHQEDLLIGIHSHPGSQVEDLDDLQNYITFLVNTYIQLYKDGFTNIRIINYGGGLPINYDSNLPSGLIENYCQLIVKTSIKLIADSGIDIYHPNIMIEAGRAVTALSAMVLIRPLEVKSIFPNNIPDIEEKSIIEKYLGDMEFSSPEEILKYWIKWNNKINSISYHDLLNFELDTGIIKKYLRSKLFNLPNFEEHIHSLAYTKLMNPDHYIVGNFSVFNSVCDSVLVNQYFPIIPTSDLDKQPELLIRLTDITCDSDGEISTFRTKKSEKVLTTQNGYPLTSSKVIEWNGFPIGSIKNIKSSFIAIPLAGAYQDVIEFDHNLIGDLPDIEFSIEDDNIILKKLSRAQSVKDIVKELGYDIEHEDDPYID
ncbi:MAG: hypothetical protein OEZ01_15735, partial [Candidatus Heimdallarchaeota archaeon]|nr:hypothetical protein [Candidatus Heimdallarchaeota archaeon]